MVGHPQATKLQFSMYLFLDQKFSQFCYQRYKFFSALQWCHLHTAKRSSCDNLLEKTLLFGDKNIDNVNKITILYWLCMITLRFRQVLAPSYLPICNFI